MNPILNALLTDTYQITMAYGYFKNKSHMKRAVFELYFRKAPFKGEFAVFSGLSESLNFVKNFKFTESDVEFINQNVFSGSIDEDYKNWLLSVDCSEITIRSIKEGSIVFPKVPLLSVEGPIAVVQLLETALLNSVNFATLIATNAARLRLCAGFDKKLLEFGLRRAQGPDGAMSASRYSYQGGFDGTSNVLAGKEFNIPISGTHAHSFVTFFSSLEDVETRELTSKDGDRTVDFVQLVQKVKRENKITGTNEGELAAFISYAIAFPDRFLGLIDTYDTLLSGVKNFMVVALSLHELGYKALGIRLDSGDLAYLSREVRQVFTEYAELYNIDYLKDMTIVASNDLDVKVISSLNDQGHEINAFGVGTNLVTCKGNPALGGVYKLVQIADIPRIKLSQDKVKITIPGRKRVFRLYLQSGEAVLDLLQRSNEEIPKVGKKILCRDPFNEDKRLYVTPSKVEEILDTVYDRGVITNEDTTIHEIRQNVIDQLKTFRSDYLRILNPSPYKVSVSEDLFTFLHELKEKEAPIKELC